LEARESDRWGGSYTPALILCSVTAKLLLGSNFPLDPSKWTLDPKRFSYTSTNPQGKPAERRAISRCFIFNAFLLSGLFFVSCFCPNQLSESIAAGGHGV